MQRTLWATSSLLFLFLVSAPRAQTWTSTNYAVGTGPRGIALIDRDGNGGVMDLAVANAAAGTVTLLDNNGSGGFTLGATVTLPAPGPVALAAGKLDGIGNRNDLVVACADPVSPGVYQIARILQAGALAPTASAVSVGNRRPVHIACADLDGDGLDEILVGSEGELFAGGGGLEILSATVPNANAAAGRVVRIVVGNFDPQFNSQNVPTDTDLDVALLIKGNPDSVTLLSNDGGTLTVRGSISLAGLTGFATSCCGGDIDGDGDMDLVSLFPDALGPNNAFRVHVNNGALALTAANITAGKFALVGPFSLTGSYAIDVSCGDFQNDTVCGPNTRAFVGQGRKDVCVINGGLGAPVVNSAFNGVTFASTATPSTGTNPVASVMADFNGDGCDDVAIANQGSSNVTVNLTRPPALAQPFGVGCAGSSGVPAISAPGLPTSGAPAFTAMLANARINALAVVMFSAPASGCAIDLQLQLTACYLYLPDPIVTVFVFTTGTGTAALTFGIPAAVPLGVDAYLQWAVFDPAGAFGPNVLALSNALRLQVGL